MKRRLVRFEGGEMRRDANVVYMPGRGWVTLQRKRKRNLIRVSAKPAKFRG